MVAHTTLLEISCHGSMFSSYNLVEEFGCVREKFLSLIELHICILTQENAWISVGRIVKGKAKLSLT